MGLQTVGHDLVTEQQQQVFPGASVVKSPPAVQGMHVPSLGQEDPLKEGMPTHSGILSWRIQRTEDPGTLQSIGLQELDMIEATEPACTRADI